LRLTALLLFIHLLGSSWSRDALYLLFLASYAYVSWMNLGCNRFKLENLCLVFNALLLVAYDVYNLVKCNGMTMMCVWDGYYAPLVKRSCLNFTNWTCAHYIAEWWTPGEPLRVPSRVLRTTLHHLPKHWPKW